MNYGQGYFEQAYQCSTCKSKIIYSSQKINLAWELLLNSKEKFD